MYADSLEEYSHIVMFDFPRTDNVANIMLVSVLQQNKKFTLCVCMTSDVYRCLLMMFNVMEFKLLNLKLQDARRL